MAGKCPWCGHFVVYGRALPPEWTSESRTIRFEFHNGFMDGRVITGKVAVQDENTPLLLRYLYLTNGGRVGTRFDEIRKLESDVWDKIKEAIDAKDTNAAKELIKKHGLGQQTYEVTQRDEKPDEILIRVDYVDWDP